MSAKYTYSSWAAMKQRCNNPRNPNYKDYGGRGITVCERWNNSFDAFLTDMKIRPYGLSIERVNNEKGYFPGNCIWATREQQAQNKRSTVRLLGVRVVNRNLITLTEMRRLAVLGLLNKEI